MHRALLALMLTVPAVAQATPAGYQDTAAIDRAVAAFTGKGIGEEGGARAAVDARLRLAQCPTVSLSWRAENHDSVVVVCTGPEWRLFVPMRLPAAAPVAAAIPAATVASAPAAPRRPPVIRRGDAVSINAGDDSFSITRDGIAMTDAAPGERVQLRVDGTRQPIQAIALSAGRAELTNWQQ